MNQKELEEQDKTFTMTVDNWSHRLCGFQQAHAIFRANWHYVRSSDKQFRDFKHMSRLEERGVNVHNKMVKLEDVGVRLSKVVESVIAGSNTSTTRVAGGTSVLSAVPFYQSYELLSSDKFSMMYSTLVKKIIHNIIASHKVYFSPTVQV